MNVHNCRKCGRIFNYVVGPYICPACRETMDAKFTQVKEFIRENRGVGIQEVAEECDVEVSQIHQWLREERLELMEGSGIVLQCEGCGGVITSGRYCVRCKKELSLELRNAALRPTAPTPEINKQTRDRDKMRFLK